MNVRLSAKLKFSPKYELRIAKACSVTAQNAAGLGTNNNRVVYTCGGGVAAAQFVDNALQNLNFRIFAPKLHEFETQSQQRKLNFDAIPREKPNPAKLKLNQVSCVAISCSGYIAFGENGYMPRVCLFSPNGTQLVSSVQEHQFGVQRLAFNPSGKLLATLGTPNDGFLYIWNVGSKLSVCASNRCISEISALAWLSDSVLVTIGVRHVRIWTVPPEGNVLTGRNVVLGDAADNRFSAITALDTSTFLVGTSSGTLYKIADNGAIFDSIAKCELAIQGLQKTANGFAISGPEEILYVNPEFEIIESAAVRNLGIASSEGKLLYLHNNAVYTESQRLTGLNYRGICHADKLFGWIGSTLHELSPDLKVLSEHSFDTEIINVHISEVQVIALNNGVVSVDGNTFNAHEEDVSDILIDATNTLVITGGSDKSLQFFSKEQDNWVQWQTLPLRSRIVAVSIVSPQKVFVCTSDKCVHCIQRDSAGVYASVKTFPLSSTPFDMIVQEDKIMVSTLDKKITVFSLTGTILDSYATVDILNEPVIVHKMKLVHINDVPYILASSSDKSLCLYERENLVACQWAHSEVPTSLAYISASGVVFSAASDGLFMYKLLEKSDTPLSPKPSSPTRILRSPSPVRRLRNATSTSSLRPPSPTRTTLSRQTTQATTANRTNANRGTNTARGQTRQPRSPSPSRLQTASSNLLSSRELSKPDSVSPAKLLPAVKLVKSAEARSDATTPETDPSEVQRPNPFSDSSDRTADLNLCRALESFIESADKDNCETELLPLLIKALEKVDQKKALSYYSKEIAKYFS